MLGWGWGVTEALLLPSAVPSAGEVLRVPATILLYAVRARAATRVA